MKTIVFKKQLSSKIEPILLLTLLFLFDQKAFASAISIPSNVTALSVGLDGQINYWGTTIKTTLDAAVAVFAIVGGFIIFIQYMQGNEQAQKNFIKFVIGLSIFALAEGILAVFI